MNPPPQLPLKNKNIRKGGKFTKNSLCSYCGKRHSTDKAKKQCKNQQQRTKYNKQIIISDLIEQQSENIPDKIQDDRQSNFQDEQKENMKNPQKNNNKLNQINNFHNIQKKKNWFQLDKTQISLSDIQEIKQYLKQNLIQIESLVKYQQITIIIKDQIEEQQQINYIEIYEPQTKQKIQIIRTKLAKYRRQRKQFKHICKENYKIQRQLIQLQRQINVKLEKYRKQRQLFKKICQRKQKIWLQLVQLQKIIDDKKSTKRQINIERAMQIREQLTIYTQFKSQNSKIHINDLLKSVQIVSLDEFYQNDQCFKKIETFYLQKEHYDKLREQDGLQWQQIYIEKQKKFRKQYTQYKKITKIKNLQDLLNLNQKMLLRTKIHEHPYQSILLFSFLKFNVLKIENMPQQNQFKNQTNIICLLLIRRFLQSDYFIKEKVIKKLQSQFSAEYLQIAKQQSNEAIMHRRKKRILHEQRVVQRYQNILSRRSLKKYKKIMQEKQMAQQNDDLSFYLKRISVIKKLFQKDKFILKRYGSFTTPKISYKQFIKKEYHFLPSATKYFKISTNYSIRKLQFNLLYGVTYINLDLYRYQFIQLIKKIDQFNGFGVQGIHFKTNKNQYLLLKKAKAKYLDKSPYKQLLKQFKIMNANTKKIQNSDKQEEWGKNYQFVKCKLIQFFNSQKQINAKFRQQNHIQDRLLDNNQVKFQTNFQQRQKRRATIRNRRKKFNYKIKQCKKQLFKKQQIQYVQIQIQPQSEQQIIINQQYQKKFNQWSRQRENKTVEQKQNRQINNQRIDNERIKRYLKQNKIKQSQNFLSIQRYIYSYCKSFGISHSAGIHFQIQKINKNYHQFNQIILQLNSKKFIDLLVYERSYLQYQKIKQPCNSVKFEFIYKLPIQQKIINSKIKISFKKTNLLLQNIQKICLQNNIPPMKIFPSIFFLQQNQFIEEKMKNIITSEFQQQLDRYLQQKYPYEQIILKVQNKIRWIVKQKYINEMKILQQQIYQQYKNIMIRRPFLLQTQLQFLKKINFWLIYVNEQKITLTSNGLYMKNRIKSFLQSLDVIRQNTYESPVRLCNQMALQKIKLINPRQRILINNLKNTFEHFIQINQQLFQNKNYICFSKYRTVFKYVDFQQLKSKKLQEFLSDYSNKDIMSDLYGEKPLIKYYTSPCQINLQRINNKINKQCYLSKKELQKYMKSQKIVNIPYKQSDREEKLKQMEINFAIEDQRKKEQKQQNQYSKTFIFKMKQIFDQCQQSTYDKCPLQDFIKFAKKCKLRPMKKIIIKYNENDEPKPEPNPEPNPESNSEHKPEPKPEPNTESNPNQNPNPQSNSEHKPENKPEPNTESNPNQNPNPQNQDIEYEQYDNIKKKIKL